MNSLISLEAKGEIREFEAEMIEGEAVALVSCFNHQGNSQVPHSGSRSHTLCLFAVEYTSGKL